MCKVGFEAYGGRVFHEDIVEKGSVLNSGEHGRGGCCDNITFNSEMNVSRMQRNEFGKRIAESLKELR